MANNDKAQTAYAAAHQEAVDLCGAISSALIDMDAPSERTDWGDVANLVKTVSDLREIARFLGMDE